jgi:hypothetical protein
MKKKTVSPREGPTRDEVETVIIILLEEVGLIAEMVVTLIPPATVKPSINPASTAEATCQKRKKNTTTDQKLTKVICEARIVQEENDMGIVQTLN